jgi:hypothetical protein
MGKHKGNKGSRKGAKLRDLTPKKAGSVKGGDPSPHLRKP